MADLIDLTGKRYGKLIVLKKGNGRKTSGGQYKATWVCKCDCGEITEVDGEKLRKGHTTSCGCEKKNNKGGRFEDLTGMRFGRLTVVRFLTQAERTTRQYDWWCRCDCGKEIKASANKLKTGRQQSCGCLKEECKQKIGEVNKKYKYTNKRLYSVYKAMIERCLDPQNSAWKNYGALGVKVCKEWLGDKGYDNFAEWALENGYDPNAGRGECTLDRTDTTKGYSPDNCRWVTNLKQQNNRRYNLRYTYGGRTQTLAEWSRELNIPYGTLRQGIRKYGKTLEYYINEYPTRGRG